MTIEDSSSYLVLWDLPQNARLELHDLDEIIEQGFDPYDTDSMASLFRCNVTLVTTTQKTLITSATTYEELKHEQQHLP